MLGPEEAALGPLGRQEVVAGRVPEGGGHLFRVLADGRLELRLGHVPDEDRPVYGPGGHQAPVRREAGARGLQTHAEAVGRERPDHLVHLQVDQPQRVVLGAGEQLAAVGTQRQRGHLSLQEHLVRAHVRPRNRSGVEE